MNARQRKALQKKFEAATKLSEIAEMACDDFEGVLNNPQYTIYMNSWHVPEDNKCSVCLAGSVMAGRGYLKPTEDYDYCFDRFSGTAVDRKFEALDSLRSGDVFEALEYLGLEDTMPYERSEAIEDDVKSIIGKFRDASNRREGRAFLGRLRKVVDLLKREGL